MSGSSQPVSISMHSGFVIENARIVLPDAELFGWVAVECGKIAQFGEGAAPETGIDFAGDYLIPGLIELHTDHLESHLKPRPKVDWPKRASILAYDAQLAASGITTVFDSLRIGSDADYSPKGQDVPELMNEIQALRDARLLRTDHRTHLRCEICSEDVVAAAQRAVDEHSVDLFSLMDHTPGARQFVSIEAWKTYYGGKSGLPESKLEQLMARKRELHDAYYKRNRVELVNLAHAHGIALASHDDSTEEHVRESIGDRVAIAEFPTTMAAAAQSHTASIAVLMGAPNVVRGGSHSGNIAAEALAREGVLDILSSDYVPAALLMGAFTLAGRIADYGLPRAIRTVTANPARATGLDDRGRIEKGLRADLVRVSVTEELPVVREVYRKGVRIV